MKQSQALDILKMGHNVFLTGAAGSGKTFVLNEFIRYLKENRVGVAVTASTGIAATHLNGMTIHSWAGIGIADELDDRQLKKLAEKKQLVARFERTKVLIIDEVSMLHGARLDLVDKVAREIKDETRPFGGLQVVLSGDLFQLPPVTRGGDPDFVFQSDAWNSMNLRICYLDEQHRQDDAQLLGILNGIRDQSLEDDYHGGLLRERMEEKGSKGNVTRLYTHNADVDDINREQLEQIEDDSETYYMTSKGSKRLVESLINSCLAPEILELKIGAEVMFVANNPGQGFMNGTRGRVIEFDPFNQPVIETTDGKTIKPEIFSWKMMDGDKVAAQIDQLPLRHAWAITVHKSQGMTLDAAEVDLSKSFEPGMGYVALSRVRSLDGLRLLGVNNVAFMVSPIVTELDEDLRSNSSQLRRALEELEEKQIKENQKKVVEKLAVKKVEDEDFEYDEALYEKLKDWRSSHAQEIEMPAYIIFHDATLKHIAAARPRTSDELLKLPGLGPKKIEDYGDHVLKITKAKKS